MDLAPELKASRTEHALLRVGFAATLLLAYLTKPIQGKDQLFPKGVTLYFDLTFLADPKVYWPLFALAALAVALYAAGRFMIPALAYLLAFTVAVFTFGMSHISKTRHDTNIVALVLLGQLIAHVHWQWVARRGDPNARFGQRSRDDLAVYYGMQMIAAMYVLSGITKMIKTGGEWIHDCPLVALQVVRTQHNEYYSHLTPADGLHHWLAVGNFLLEHRGFTKLLFGSAMVLEMFAFAALMGRIPALFIGASLIVFHLSVYHLMFIDFYLNIIVLALFFVNVPHWILRWRDRGTRESRAPDAASAAA